MGIASFLNDNLNFQESSHLPINPATKEQPLTIPSTIQLAEYGENDFVSRPGSRTQAVFF